MRSLIWLAGGIALLTQGCNLFGIETYVGHYLIGFENTPLFYLCGSRDAWIVEGNTDDVWKTVSTSDGDGAAFVRWEGKLGKDDAGYPRLKVTKLLEARAPGPNDC